MIDTNEFWDAFTSSEFADCQDFIKGIEGEDLRFPLPLNFIHITENDNTEVETYLTVEQLKEAYAKAITNNETHCGGESLDMDDPDACFTNTVLQYALYGKVVFG